MFSGMAVSSRGGALSGMGRHVTSATWGRALSLAARERGYTAGCRVSADPDADTREHPVVGRRFCQIIAPPFVVIAWRAQTRVPRAALTGRCRYHFATLICVSWSNLRVIQLLRCNSDARSVKLAITSLRHFSLWERCRCSVGVERFRAVPESRSVLLDVHQQWLFVIRAVSRYQFYAAFTATLIRCCRDLRTPRRLRPQFRGFSWITETGGRRAGFLSQTSGAPRSQCELDFFKVALNTALTWMRDRVM